jgi:hypothetical protein
MRGVVEHAPAAIRMSTGDRVGIPPRRLHGRRRVAPIRRLPLNTRLGALGDADKCLG